ncbi:MAG TPA: hypothetical protein VGF48_20860 [Thermoanaerobaculia bacterium]
MSELASLQRGLASLIRGERPGTEDCYLREVAGSPRLNIVRDVIASWRDLLLRRAAPLTTRVLDERGRLGDALARIACRPESPFVEDLAMSFLADYEADDDSLVAEIARFEREMITRARLARD